VCSMQCGGNGSMIDFSLHITHFTPHTTHYTLQTMHHTLHTTLTWAHTGQPGGRLAASRGPGCGYGYTKWCKVCRKMSTMHYTHRYTSTRTHIFSLTRRRRRRRRRRSHSAWFLCVIRPYSCRSTVYTIERD
jgi:hypothetical protein